MAAGAKRRRPRLPFDPRRSSRAWTSQCGPYGVSMIPAVSTTPTAWSASGFDLAVAGDPAWRVGGGGHVHQDDTSAGKPGLKDEPGFHHGVLAEVEVLVVRLLDLERGAVRAELPVITTMTWAQVGFPSASRKTWKVPLPLRVQEMAGTVIDRCRYNGGGSTARC